MNGEQLIHEQIKALQSLELNFQSYKSDPNFIAPHWHSSVEIIYVINGKMDVSEDAGQHTITGGDFVLINSKSVHSTRWNESLDWYLLQIPQEFLKRYAPKAMGISFFPDKKKDEEKYNACCEILKRLPDIYNDGGDYMALSFFSEIFKLLFILCDSFSIKKTENESSVLDRLEPTLRYIKENYSSPISLSDTASTAGLTPEYFCRFFKRNMGMTFLEYLNSIRLEHIYNDLVYTDTTLTALLDKHGFTNYKLFLKLFKKAYGSSPSQIRQRRKVD